MKGNNRFAWILSIFVLAFAVFSAFKMDAAAEEIIDGDLTFEEGGQPYRPTKEERLIEEMKDQAMTKALKFRIDLYAGQGLSFENIKERYPTGVDQEQLLEYINGIDRKKTVWEERDMGFLLIRPYQYDHVFYELSTVVKEYEVWAEEAKENLQKNKWIIMQKYVKNRPVCLGIDACAGEESLFRCRDITKKGLTYSWTEAEELYEGRVSDNRFIEVWD